MATYIGSEEVNIFCGQPIGGGGGNAQTVQVSSRVSTPSGSYAKACGDITVAKTGTYDVYWTCYRTSTSGNWGSRLYIGSEAQTEYTSFSSYFQEVHMTNVSLTKDDVIRVGATTRGTNYYAYVGQLTIIEV